MDTTGATLSSPFLGSPQAVGSAERAPRIPRWVGELINTVNQFRVREATGGPIHRFEWGTIAAENHQLHICNAYLRGELKPAHLPQLHMFSNADGSGISASFHQAKAKATSEALERWAFWHTMQHGFRRQYGMDVDPTTKGMAAYPGFNHSLSKRIARLEAAERFGVMGWWEGYLDGKLISSAEQRCEYVLIEVLDTSVSIAFRKLQNGLYAYGMGAGTQPEEAMRHAHREMLATGHNLTYLKQPDRPRSLTDKEQRMLYFASETGHAHFKSRIGQRSWRKPIQPEVLFDGPITGDWCRYAKVWRCCWKPIRPIQHLPTEFFYL